MKQKSLSNWLKFAIICLAVIGAEIYGFVVPQYGRTIVESAPDYAHCYLPWLFFVLVTAVPCYAALVCAWHVAVQIGRDNSFSYTNARMLKIIAVLSAADGLYFFIGNLVLLFLGMNHPGIVLLSLVPEILAAAASIASAALSHLIRNAADMKQDSDLTI